MTIKFTNNATTTLASGINASVTSLTVASGAGALFPTLTGGDVFYVTLANVGGSVEIVQVTARTTDTFTIVRGQDGTTAKTWATGDKVELRPVAAGMAAMAQTANNLSDLASAATARTNLGLVIGTNVQAWDADLDTWATKTAPTGTVVGTSDTQTLTNKTLTNPTVTNYVETLYAPASGTAFTLDLANGTVQKFTSSGNLTLTLPASSAGKSYLVIVAYGGAHTLTWAGGSTIKWPGGTAPTASATSGKFDIFSFFCDGTNTYGQSVGLNY